MFICSPPANDNNNFDEFIRILASELSLTYINEFRRNDVIFCLCDNNVQQYLKTIVEENLKPEAVLLFSPSFSKLLFREFYKIGFPVLIVANRNNMEELRSGWIYHDNIADSKMENVSGDNQELWVSRRTQCISLTKKFLANGFKII
jgi:hypothetical protein